MSNYPHITIDGQPLYVLTYQRGEDTGHTRIFIADSRE
jgi:hypothetical protein